MSDCPLGPEKCYGYYYLEEELGNLRLNYKNLYEDYDKAVKLLSFWLRIADEDKITGQLVEDTKDFLKDRIRNNSNEQ